MSRDEILPIEIYANLEYIGLTPEGDIYIQLRKENKRVATTLVTMLRKVINSEVYVYIDRGRWENQK